VGEGVGEVTPPKPARKTPTHPAPPAGRQNVAKRHENPPKNDSKRGKMLPSKNYTERKQPLNGFKNHT